MAGLSLQEIADFNNPAAFTRSRTVGASATSSPSSIDTSRNKQTLKTQSLNESFSLVSGIANRLELIQGNLFTMLQLANEGLSVTNETDRDEIFGKLRSLTGGIDDIVDATVFNNQSTLDGRTLNLSFTSNGTVDRRLELGNYYGANEEGLDLSRQPSYAVTDTFYDFYSSSRNANSGIVGLDVTESFASSVQNTEVELETGTYQIEISYAGPDSTVSILNSNGVLLNTVEDVDLSGNDKVSVNTGLGLTFTIDNDNYTNTSGEVVALVDYRASEVSNEDFDFRQYVNRIEDALELVAADIEVMATVQNDILNLNSLLNGSGLQSSGSGAFVGQLIGGAIDGTTSAAFASNQVAQAGAEIFQATGNATAVQAEVLATRAASAQLA